MFGMTKSRTECLRGVKNKPVCRYDEDLTATLEGAPVARTAWEAQGWQGDVRLQYHSQLEFEHLVSMFGMMKEWRDGVPRAAYHGVVSFLDQCSIQSNALRWDNPACTTTAEW